MSFKILLVMIAVLGSFQTAMSNCDTGHGKTTCITEDLLHMLMGMNTGKGHETDNSGPQNKPAFYAFLKNSATYNGEVFKFDDVKTNIGNNYNPSTGEFTAPRNGIYLIYCAILASGNNDVYYQLNKNDELFGNALTSKNLFSSSTNMWMVELKKGDRVYIKHRSSSQAVQGQGYSYFGGYLL